MLCFLRGPLFEPLSSCFLCDFTQKVLFLVSLATARRVSELQAVSHDVSFFGSDIYQLYLPEFRAKTKSSVHPLPRSFCVRSLADFVGDRPEELLLCPVHALRLYILRVSFVYPRPRSLCISSRSPTRALSKNALSFFPFFVTSFLTPIPLPLLLLLGLLPLLPPFGLIACVESQLHGLFRVTLLSRLSLRLLCGLPLPCSLLFT